VVRWGKTGYAKLYDVKKKVERGASVKKSGGEVPKREGPPYVETIRGNGFHEKGVRPSRKIRNESTQEREKCKGRLDL